MKQVAQTIILALIVLIFACADAMIVEWRDEFQEVYERSGIDDAVVRALRRGVTPDNIMIYGLKFEELNPKDLVKAMYCSGIMGEDIRYAGERQDLAETIIVGGYKKAVEECREKIGFSLLFVPLPNEGTSISPDTFIAN